MPHLTALVFLLDASSSSKSKSSPYTLVILVAIVALGYFLLIRPQQRKSRAARAAAQVPFAVGDDVQTVGGIIGTVLEVHGDRYTLLTGHTEADGNLDGVQPTRIVFVRQAIARKVERIADVGIDDVDHDSAEIDDGPDSGEDEETKKQ